MTDDRRATGKRPALAAPYGSGGGGEAAESSSSASAGAGRQAGRAGAPGDVVLSLRRLDGLSCEVLLDGSLLEKLRWPEDTIRMTFGKMLREFMDMAREIEPGRYGEG